MYRKKVVLIIFCLIIFIIGGVSLYLPSQYVVPILNYHSISKNGVLGLLASSSVVSPEIFLKQMNFLKKSKYKVITLEKLVSDIKARKKSFYKSVVITFDDGYKDNFKEAYPVLKKYGFPATIFVTVGNIGKSGYLDYGQIKAMLKDNISFGSHTIGHPYLPDLKREDLEYQIIQSKKILEDNLKENIDFIAYPIGGFTSEIQDIVRQAGYKAAFTTNRGIIKSYNNDDLYALKRNKVTNKDRGFKFWVKVSGYYNLLRKVKNQD